MYELLWRLLVHGTLDFSKLLDVQLMLLILPLGGEDLARRWNRSIHGYWLLVVSIFALL